MILGGNSRAKRSLEGSMVIFGVFVGGSARNCAVGIGMQRKCLTRLSMCKNLEVDAKMWGG